MALKAKQRSDMNISDSEDVKVDILECNENPKDDIHQEEEVLREEATSSSSSFADSLCARDDYNSGFEAQSMLSEDYPLPDEFNDFSSGLRKKKVTDEWRRFSQPIMWRCKWLELKVKELKSQAKAYEKEIQSHYENKEFHLEKAKFEGFNGKSIPFNDKVERMSLFKRRRRKRVEETDNVATYMSNHNVFSYSERRKPSSNKAQNSDQDIVTTRRATTDENEDDCCLVSEMDSRDDYLAKILRKIDEAQERAKALRKRVDQLTMESESPPQKQCVVVEEAVTTVTNQTVQIGWQRISADSQDPPPVEILNLDSPVSSGGLRFHTILEDMLMDETEMNDADGQTEEEKMSYFTKLMDSITGVPEDEEDEDEDPTPLIKRRKT